MQFICGTISVTAISTGYINTGSIMVFSAILIGSISADVVITRASGANVTCSIDDTAPSCTFIASDDL